MDSSVIFRGFPTGDVAAFIEPCAAPTLATPPEIKTAPPMDNGIAEAADVTCPDAATECAALALACPLACTALLTA